MFAGMCSLVLGLGLCAGDGVMVEIEPLRFGYFYGTTEYEIEGDAWEWGDDWRSRLTFPVSNKILGGGFGFMFGRTWEIRARAWGTVTDDAGTMEDDDWINGQKVIWSESDAELMAFGASAEATIWALKGSKGGFGPRFRLEYDQLDYDISDVEQDSVDPDYVAYIPGRCLTYRQERVSFSPGLAGRLSPVEWLEMGAFVGVGPCDYVWDEDDHLLRDKRSEMQTVGVSVRAGLHLDFIIVRHIRLGIWGEYLYYKSYWGSQDQEFYGGDNEGLEFDDIDGEIERSTGMAGFHIAVDF